MKLGLGSGGEISFAMNKEEEECEIYPPVGMLKGGLTASETGEYSLDSNNDPCKFWVCEFETQTNDEEWSTCVQKQRTWPNYPLYLQAGWDAFTQCTNDCDSCGDYDDERFIRSCECEKGERKYTQINPAHSTDPLEPEKLEVCCVDATEESDLEIVTDEVSGKYKIECQPKCLAPCGKWICSNLLGNPDGACDQITDFIPNGIEQFYDTKEECEQAQPNCGKWWCDGSGTCKLITQADPVSSEENWSGRIFESQSACQDFGCGKYYCYLVGGSNGPFLENLPAECQKVDGSPKPDGQTGGGNRPEGATLFDVHEDCMSSCGKWYCSSPPTGGEPTSCSRVMSNTSVGSYSGLYGEKSQCEDLSGCGGDKKWICSGGAYCEQLTWDQAQAAGFDAFVWQDAKFTQSDCRLANQGCCPPGNQYNPSTDQCVPA